MKILSWNVRGALGKEFDMVFRQIVASKRPDLAIIQEPRCSGPRAVGTIRKLGFRFHAISEARGYACKIWIIWNDNSLNINIIERHDQFIHAEVSAPNVDSWLLIAAYASPRN